MKQDTKPFVNVIEQLQQRRIPMVALPTPLEEAGRLPSVRRLLIKRDDLTGLGMGGNKTRKAETLCADALAGNADLGQPAVFAAHGAPDRRAETALITRTIPSLDLEMT